MRVPVLIAITFASGTTALLESVMRPVSDAFVDCARSGVTEDKRMPTMTSIARKAACQDHLALHKRKTKFKIIILLPLLQESQVGPGRIPRSNKTPALRPRC